MTPSSSPIPARRAPTCRRTTAAAGGAALHHQPRARCARLRARRGDGRADGRADAKIVSLMGDGSFGFACGELETLVRHRIPLTAVVFSNAAFGWIKAGQRTGFGGALPQRRLRAHGPRGGGGRLRREELAVEDPTRSPAVLARRWSMTASARGRDLRSPGRGRRAGLGVGRVTGRRNAPTPPVRRPSSAPASSVSRPPSGSGARATAWCSSTRWARRRGRATATAVCWLVLRIVPVTGPASSQGAADAPRPGQPLYLRWSYRHACALVAAYLVPRTTPRRRADRRGAGALISDSVADHGRSPRAPGPSVASRPATTLHLSAPCPYEADAFGWDRCRAPRLRLARAGGRRPARPRPGLRRGGRLRRTLTGHGHILDPGRLREGAGRPCGGAGGAPGSARRVEDRRARRSRHGRARGGETIAADAVVLTAGRLVGPLAASPRPPRAVRERARLPPGAVRALHHAPRTDHGGARRVRRHADGGSAAASPGSSSSAACRRGRPRALRLLVARSGRRCRGSTWAREVALDGPSSGARRFDPR